MPLAIRVWLVGVIAFVVLLIMVAVFAESPAAPRSKANNGTADDDCAGILFQMEDPECFSMPPGWDDGAFATQGYRRQTVRTGPQATPL